MVDGLFYPDGSFRKFSPEALTSEIATRANAGGLLDGSYSYFLNLLPDPDPILRKRGDDSFVLEELAADDQVTAAMLGRKERVLRRDDYAITPGALEGEEPTQTAILLADRLTLDLERTSLHDIISEILDAPFYGMVPLEILWEPAGNWWHIKDIIPRPYYWFAYNIDNQLVFKGENYLYSEPLPFGKFVVARHHPTFRNPYGLRLLSRCLWPVAFKRGGIEFYVRFVEKFGIPHTVAKAPSKATAEEKRKIAADLASIVTNAVAVLPAGSEVNFETVSGNPGEIHENFLRRWDKAISKVLSGQTLTLEMEGANSLAASETHADVAEGISLADRRIVTAALNEICWLYARINAGERELCPVFSYKEVEDLHARAELDQKLYAMGVEFTGEHFINVYKLSEDEFNLKTSSSLSSPADRPADGAEAANASFAASPAAPVVQSGVLPRAGDLKAQEDAQARIDEIARRYVPELVKANAGFVRQIENAVKEAESYEELEYLLAAVLDGQAGPDEFEDLLGALITSSAAFGANAVHNELAGEEDA